MYCVYNSMKRSLNAVLVLFLLTLFREVCTDLPVHCKREQIEGLWTFRISQETFDASLNNPQTHCGHGFPDKIDKNIGDVNFRFNSFRDVEMHLSSDYKIYNSHDKSQQIGKWTPVYDEAFVVYFGNSVFTAFMKYFLKDRNVDSTKNENFLSNCDKTMIGWYVPDKNNKDKNWSCFFGFKSKLKREFNYNRFMQQMVTPHKKNSSPENQINSNFIEMASKTDTTIGLHLMKYDQNDLVNEINSMNLSWKAGVHEEFRGLSFFQLKEHLGLKRTKQRKSSDSSEDLKGFESNNLPQNEVENIDSILNTWSSLEMNSDESKNQIGKKNKLDAIGSNIVENFDDFSSKNQANYRPQNGALNFDSIVSGDGQDNLLLSNFQPKKYGSSNINNRIIVKQNSENSQISSFSSNSSKDSIPIGSNENSSNQIDDDSSQVTDPLIIQKYLDKEIDDIDVTKLPKNWDWRNVGGVNFVPSPRRQLNCGSCYIFSLVSSLESRLRIMTNNKDRTEFSRQFPLGCSFYTEGCQGGYPFLVAKFFHEFEVIPESCAPYDPVNVNCHNTCDYTQHPIKYTVSKYEYLGGFYGATNEIDILKEIRARGPIPGNMSVPWTFSYYKEGIYSQNSLIKNTGNFSKTTLFDKNLSWSSVDHSILLVGYGEENGIKYWIGMNTWGTQWGEGGYFRILRGENECNIETMGDAARISFSPRFK